MKTRTNQSASNLKEVLHLLNSKNKDLYSNIWVGRDYCLKQLIEDIQAVEQRHQNIFNEIVLAKEDVIRYHVGDDCYDNILKEMER